MLYVLLLVLKFDQQHFKGFLLTLMSFPYMDTVFYAFIFDYISTKFDTKSCMLNIILYIAIFSYRTMFVVSKKVPKIADWTKTST